MKSCSTHQTTAILLETDISKFAAIIVVDVAELIKGKNIYIFGGHINWRTRLKSNYPSLNIMDGHNPSFDEQQLLNADIVLLNTSNMSHALYYKVIEVLRKNKIRFDYLGKYINQNLLEQEIAEILKRI